MATSVASELEDEGHGESHPLAFSCMHRPQILLVKLTDRLKECHGLKVFKLESSSGGQLLKFKSEWQVLQFLNIKYPLIFFFLNVDIKPPYLLANNSGGQKRINNKQ